MAVARGRQGDRDQGEGSRIPAMQAILFAAWDLASKKFAKISPLPLAHA